MMAVVNMQSHLTLLTGTTIQRKIATQAESHKLQHVSGLVELRITTCYILSITH